MNALNQLWVPQMPPARPAWWTILVVATVALWLLPSAGHAAQPARAFTTTNTIVKCTNGASYLTTNFVFRGDVRVFDPQLYLECERLTLYLATNAVGSTPKAGTGPDVGNINAVVAETNVLMMMQGATIIGDRAIYSPTNDLVQILGEIVVIDTARGYAYGTNFIFNRRTMDLHSIGPSTLESKPGVSLIEGATNSLPGGLPGVTRPRRASPPRPSGSTNP